MLEYLLSGLVTTLMFLLPLIPLSLVSGGFYWLHIHRRRGELSTDEFTLLRLNFNIFKYVVYLILIPIILVVTSVFVAISGGVPVLLDRIIWLSAAIMIGLAWSLLRLVTCVSAKTRIAEAKGLSTGADMA
jgi:hypothetical protein